MHSENSSAAILEYAFELVPVYNYRLNLRIISSYTVLKVYFEGELAHRKGTTITELHSTIESHT
jgi:hypothetical protein